MQADRNESRSTRPRRVKTNRPGIYYREAATKQNGKPKRIYEYTYRDGQGVQRWPGGFATLAEAEDARAETMRRIRRGEEGSRGSAFIADVERQDAVGQRIADVQNARRRPVEDHADTGSRIRVSRVGGPCGDDRDRRERSKAERRISLPLRRPTAPPGWRCTFRRRQRRPGLRLQT